METINRFRFVLLVLITVGTSACSHVGVGKSEDAPRAVVELILNDDDSVQLRGNHLSSREQLATEFRILSKQRPQALLLVRGELPTAQESIVNLETLAYDEGLRFLMITGRNADCNRDSIRKITTPDDMPWMIWTDSGSLFEIGGQDFIDPRQWRVGQKLLVCPNWQGGDVYDLGNTVRGETLTTFRKRD